MLLYTDAVGEWISKMLHLVIRDLCWLFLSFQLNVSRSIPGGCSCYDGEHYFVVSTHYLGSMNTINRDGWTCSVMVIQCTLASRCQYTGVNVPSVCQLNILVNSLQLPSGFLKVLNPLICSRKCGNVWCMWGGALHLKGKGVFFQLFSVWMCAHCMQSNGPLNLRVGGPVLLLDQQRLTRGNLSQVYWYWVQARGKNTCF